MISFDLVKKYQDPEKLNHLREICGFTTAEMCRRIGKCESYICQCESRNKKLSYELVLLYLTVVINKLRDDKALMEFIEDFKDELEDK